MTCRVGCLEAKETNQTKPELEKEKQQLQHPRNSCSLDLGLDIDLDLAYYAMHSPSIDLG